MVSYVVDVVPVIVAAILIIKYAGNTGTNPVLPYLFLNQVLEFPYVVDVNTPLFIVNKFENLWQDLL